MCIVIQTLYFLCWQIRKVNCSRRPESVCCQSVAEERLDILDDEEDYNETEAAEDGDHGEDNLIQIASNIHEVVVKPNGEPVARKLPTTAASSEQGDTTTTPAPVSPSSSSSSSSASGTSAASPSSETTTQSATTTQESVTDKVPSFCLKLKFNCKLFSFHTCCKHQLPVSSASTAGKSTLVKITKDKVKKVEEKSESAESVDEAEENNNIEGKQNNTEKKDEKKSFIPKKEKSKFSFKNLRQKSRVFSSPLKKSLFSNNKRKAGKSGLCKIINCNRSKNHFCCEDLEATEDEVKDEEIVTEKNEPQEVATQEGVIDQDVNASNNGDAKPEGGKETTVKDVEEVSEEADDAVENIASTTMMSYDEEYTSTAPVSEIESDSASGENLSSGHEVEYNDDNTEEPSTQVGDEMTTMMSYEEFTQLNDEATTESAASTTTTEQPPQDADTREPFEEVTMTSSSKSESYEETRIWYDGINPRGEFIERRPYHIYQDEDGQDVVQVFPVYIPDPDNNYNYNYIDNDISNSVSQRRVDTDEDTDRHQVREITCAHVDCLAWPGNKCCSPHVTKKRHSHEEFEDINDKITATIIRIVKSVRWV